MDEAAFKQLILAQKSQEILAPNLPLLWRVPAVDGFDGGDLVAPVGTVWFGWAVKNPDPVCLQTSRHQFSGSRDAVRAQAVRIALEGVSRILRESG